MFGVKPVDYAARYRQGQEWLVLVKMIWERDDFAVGTSRRLLPGATPHATQVLYASGSWIARFKDMTPLESRPLLDVLHAHAARPEFMCRYRWTPGAIALLDNRCTQHFAINDYSGHRLVMHRVMFAGERPIGAKEN